MLFSITFQLTQQLSIRETQRNCFFFLFEIYEKDLWVCWGNNYKKYNLNDQYKFIFQLNY